MALVNYLKIKKWKIDGGKRTVRIFYKMNTDNCNYLVPQRSDNYLKIDKKTHVDELFKAPTKTPNFAWQ